MRDANDKQEGVTLGYDPALRLYQVAGAATTRFAYDGLNAIAEYNGSNALQRRYVFGAGVDQPLVQYEGTGTTDRRFMSADERGSVISLTDSSGTLLNLNRYDEYGKPQSTNAGRFQYTGQMWIGEIGAYYYKARVYLPHLGIFPQTDPIGYAGSPNLYAYVLNDPVNLNDPLGQLPPVPAPDPGPPIIVTGTWWSAADLFAAALAPRAGDLASTDLLGMAALAGEVASEGEQEQQEDKFCQSLKDETKKLENQWKSLDPIANFTTNFAWDNLGSLQAELNWARGDLKDLQTAARIAGPALVLFGVGRTATGLPKGKGPNIVLTLGIGAASLNLAGRIQMQQAKIQALDARIRQLRAQAAEKC